jgi:hypothetical protein
MVFSLFACDYNLFSSLLYNQISLSTLLSEVSGVKIKET